MTIKEKAFEIALTYPPHLELDGYFAPPPNARRIVTPADIENILREGREMGLEEAERKVKSLLLPAGDNTWMVVGITKSKEAVKSLRTQPK